MKLDKSSFAVRLPLRCCSPPALSADITVISLVVPTRRPQARPSDRALRQVRPGKVLPGIQRRAGQDQGHGRSQPT